MSDMKSSPAPKPRLLRAFLVGALFCIAFAYVAIVGANRKNAYLPSSQISSIAVIFGMIMVLGINPLLRMLRIRVFSRAEIFLVFIMATVPAGLSVFGFVSQVLPLSGGLHNPQFNTQQTGWDANLVPNLRQDMFVGASLFDARHVTDWDDFARQLITDDAEHMNPAAHRFFTMMPQKAQNYARELVHGKPDAAAAHAAIRDLLKRELPLIEFNGPDGPKTTFTPDEAARLAPVFEEELFAFFTQNDVEAGDAVSPLTVRLDKIFRSETIIRGGVKGRPRGAEATLLLESLTGKMTAIMAAHILVPSTDRRRQLVANGVREVLMQADLSIADPLCHALSWQTAQQGTNGLDTLMPPLEEMEEGGRLPEAWQTYLKNIFAEASAEKPHVAQRLWHFLPDQTRQAIREGATTAFCPIIQQRGIRQSVARVLSLWPFYFDIPATTDDATLGAWQSFGRMLEMSTATTWDNPGKALAAALSARGVAGLYPENVEACTALAVELKKTLADPSFYCAPAFSKVKLSPEALVLMARGARKLPRTDLYALNRLIIESVFEKSLLAIHYAQQQNAMGGYVNGIGTRGLEAFPVFIPRDDESFGMWARRFSTYFSQAPVLKQSDVRSWREWVRDLSTNRKGNALSRAMEAQLPEPLLARISELNVRFGAVEQSGTPLPAEPTEEMVALQKELDGMIPEILKAWNQILTKRDLIPDALLATHALRDEPAALHVRGYDALSDNEVVALNRFLLEDAYPDRLVRFRQYFFGEVPWGAWSGAFFFWGTLLVICAVLFYGLNELVFRQWYEQEKLVFPLARIAELILSNEDGNDQKIPTSYRMPLFWVGLLVAFTAMFYNGMVEAKIIPEMSKIDLSGTMKDKLAGTMWTGLTPQFRLHIFFALIGIAFFLPAEILFSVWFFYLFMMGQQLMAVWMGVGQNGDSFAINWLEKCNFMTAQGGGALEVFGFLCLWRIRKNLFAFLYRLAGKKDVAGLAEGDVKRYALPSFLFAAASCGLIWFMVDSGVSMGMALLTYTMILFMTIGLTRLVAECGLIGFQVWFGPVHLMKIFGLLAYPVLFAAKGLATVIVILAGVFMDLKTFMAPTMLNGCYLAEKSGIRRSSFVWALLASMFLTIVVATITSLALVYDKGVPAMDWWFSTGLPKNIFTITTSMQRNLTDLMQFDPSDVTWFAVGGGTCATIVYLRQFLFWVPHPIGLLMFVNPLMHWYWFSFFVAWVCKRAAVRYTTTDSYVRLRAFFIGLLIGECLAIAIALIMELSGYERMGISFNRFN